MVLPVGNRPDFLHFMRMGLEQRFKLQEHIKLTTNQPTNQPTNITMYHPLFVVKFVWGQSLKNQPPNNEFFRCCCVRNHSVGYRSSAVSSSISSLPSTAIALLQSTLPLSIKSATLSSACDRISASTTTSV